MYKKNIKGSGSLRVNNCVIGETIEQKISRIVNNKEPIKDGAPVIYMERKDGVKPEFNIRTDRFEVGLDAMDTVTKTKITKRLERAKEREKVQGTEQPPKTEGAA